MYKKNNLTYLIVILSLAILASCGTKVKTNYLYRGESHAYLSSSEIETVDYIKKYGFSGYWGIPNYEQYKHTHGCPACKGVGAFSDNYQRTGHKTDSAGKITEVYYSYDVYKKQICLVCYGSPYQIIPKSPSNEIRGYTILGKSDKAYALGKYKKAIELIDKAKATGQLTRDTIGKIPYRKAWIYYDMKSYPKAVEFFTQTINEDGMYKNSAYSMRAKTYYEMGNYADAVKDAMTYKKICQKYKWSDREKPMDELIANIAVKLSEQKKANSVPIHNKTTVDTTNLTKSATKPNETIASKPKVKTPKPQYRYYLIGTSNNINGSKVAVVGNEQEWPELKKVVRRYGGEPIVTNGVEARTMLEKRIVVGVLFPKRVVKQARGYLKGYKLYGVPQ